MRLTAARRHPILQLSMKAMVEYSAITARIIICKILNSALIVAHHPLSRSRDEMRKLQKDSLVYRLKQLRNKKDAGIVSETSVITLTTMVK